MAQAAQKKDEPVTKLSDHKEDSPSFKIEKDVPVPNVHQSGKWDFMEKMKNGDSFVLPKDTYEINKALGVCRSRASSFEFKITIRRLENGDVRIWRIT